MKPGLEISFAMLVLGAFSIGALSQSPEKATPEKDAELKLRIIPNKETYALHEKVFTKTEFTNLTDKTLCFPEPVQDCINSVSGYVITRGSPLVSSPEVEQFICVIDGRVGSREKLLADIKNRWIKLVPDAVYVTRSTEAKVSLDIAGQWLLKASYHPPEAAFGSVETSKYAVSAAREVGCAVPEMKVSDVPIAIIVVPSKNDK